MLVTKNPGVATPGSWNIVDAVQLNGSNNTQDLRQVQAFRLAARFGMSMSTAARTAELLFGEARS